MKRRLALFILVLVGFTTHSFTQTDAERNVGTWLMYFGTNRIAEKWSIHSEVQLRLYEVTGNFNQLLPRIGLNHHIDDKSMVTAGYAYIPTESFDKGDLLVQNFEHRIWQQFILRNKLGRVGLEHRYRIEQRWVRTEIGDLSFDNFLNRARYRIFAAFPVSRKKMEDKTVFLAFYDELFLNLDGWSFDQNRLYAALGYKVNSTLSFQCGYLYHRAGASDLNRLQFAVFFNPDLRKSSAPAE